jgi:hypothetical protein
MSLHELRDEEAALVGDVRLMPQAERETMFALGRQFRKIGEHANEEETLPAGVVPIRKANTGE